MESTELFYRIKQLFDAYADCIDEERYELWPDFFEDTCFYQITTREAHVKKMPIGIVQCNSKGMLIDRINSMHKANIFEPQRYRHMLGALHIESTGVGVTKARMGFSVIRIMESGESSLFVSGVWESEIVESSGELIFRRNVAILDSGRVDTLIVIPV